MNSLKLIISEKRKGLLPLDRFEYRFHKELSSGVKRLMWHLKTTIIVIKMLIINNNNKENIMYLVVKKSNKNQFDIFALLKQIWCFTEITGEIQFSVSNPWYFSFML
jgi:hypothetical protein